MKKRALQLVAMVIVLLGSAPVLWADNPLILDQFTADPTARVFEGKIYLFPSHDMQGRPGGWFAMEDYHVFSSENLMDWQDHGVIVDQKKVPWVNPNNSMWAPECVTRNGKYYFIFPANNRIGVAIADKPEGPYVPQAQPIAGANGIDPCCLLDPKDGTAYLVWANNSVLTIGKLKDSMVELDGQPQRLPKLTQDSGLVEGPFLFERKGVYYLTFPHVANKTERLEYAMGKSATGPFTWTGVIMDESPSGCWTNHHSLVEYQGQWYLFYHDQDLSPEFDKNRSVRADYVTFNDDGTIKKVVPTLRGIGIADARSHVQIDRYSQVSASGTADAFVDDKKRSLGWKITLSEQAAWVKYDRVDFGKGDLKSVNVRATSTAGGTIEIRLDKADSPVLASVVIGKSTDWTETKAQLGSAPSGQHDIVVTLKDKSEVALDWVSFE